MSEPESAASPVAVDRPAEHVARIRLARGDGRNALDLSTRQALADAFAACHEDEAVRAIVLTGGDRVFAAGADLEEFRGKGAVDVARERVERFFRTVAQTPQPVVAAVNGYALGGGMELAMMADIIVAGEGARFGQPEVKVGIMPGAGGTQRLTRAVGKFQAMRMCLTGRPVTAAEALAMGLASEVVPDGEVQGRAVEIASELAALPPLALRAVKEAVLAAESTSLEAGLQMERRMLQLLFASRDKEEGVSAFFEKRPPDFTGS